MALGELLRLLLKLSIISSNTENEARLNALEVDTDGHITGCQSERGAQQQEQQHGEEDQEQHQAEDQEQQQEQQQHAEDQEQQQHVGENQEQHQAEEREQQELKVHNQEQQPGRSVPNDDDNINIFTT
ncbi:ataxin-8-like [Aphidius gifuensis]|uniref:ataxin-8-like n=1 Tax=Aphidius gifuensis TaxID=684658 RepID=UPI001CDBCAB1|nr:ataxin-8-like [Aphidius gifuensis]